MKKVSIKDIARSAGVSIALVSYVLNGKEKQARIGKEIAATIKRKAKELNYQPNQIAKSLKTGKTQTIGLIVADISNPFFANIARTIEDEAKKSNYTVIFGSSDESSEKLANLIRVFLERQVDGFIIAPTENSKNHIKNIIELGKPVVLIDRYFSNIGSSYVVTDNFEASYKVVKHIMDTGHNNIAMVAYNTKLIHIQYRIKGYEKAIKESNSALQKSIVKKINFDSIEEEVGVAIDELMTMKPKVDAIFFATNTLALYGIKALTKRKHKIPADCAVACFDKGDAFDFFYSPLTFIDQPLEEEGKVAVQVLINRLNNPSAKPQQIILQSKLVIRESSGA
ncbi:MAG: substrate-binding domain-containing protein [Chitinophagaceae bacterium]|jgi:LacI family transcriptional regulator|nr:substrate-binding domain-containing protein [Chitinophagaceae bacterium]